MRAFSLQPSCPVAFSRSFRLGTHAYTREGPWFPSRASLYSLLLLTCARALLSRRISFSARGWSVGVRAAHVMPSLGASRSARNVGRQSSWRRCCLGIALRQHSDVSLGRFVAVSGLLAAYAYLARLVLITSKNLVRLELPADLSHSRKRSCLPLSRVLAPIGVKSTAIVMLPAYSVYGARYEHCARDRASTSAALGQETVHTPFSLCPPGGDNNRYSGASTELQTEVCTVLELIASVA